jgi:hypothetical protein
VEKRIAADLHTQAVRAHMHMHARISAAPVISFSAVHSHLAVFRLYFDLEHSSTHSHSDEWSPAIDDLIATSGHPLLTDALMQTSGTNDIVVINVTMTIWIWIGTHSVDW